MTTIFWEPVTLDGLLYTKDQQHIVMLGEVNCEPIPRDQYSALKHFSPAYVFRGLTLKRPSTEFVEWAKSVGIEFTVFQVWPDCCVISLNDPNDLVLFKLRW